jgi:hypothetical protein
VKSSSKVAASEAVSRWTAGRERLLSPLAVQQELYVVSPDRVQEVQEVQEEEGEVAAVCEQREEEQQEEVYGA